VTGPVREGPQPGGRVGHRHVGGWSEPGVGAGGHGGRDEDTPRALELADVDPVKHEASGAQAERSDVEVVTATAGASDRCGRQAQSIRGLAKRPYVLGLDVDDIEAEPATTPRFGPPASFGHQRAMRAGSVVASRSQPVKSGRLPSRSAG